VAGRSAVEPQGPEGPDGPVLVPPPAPEPARAGARGAVFIDLDRTLIEGSSAFEFGKASYRAGFLTRRQIAADGLANVIFRLRGSTDAAADALRMRVAHAIAGVRVRDLQRLGPSVLQGILPRVYPKMLELAYAHQDAGRPVYIVTAASQEIAELLAHVLVFDGAVGTVSEVVDGVYTGHPGGPFTYREGKALAVRELAARAGFELEASWAYSDSASDLPLLEAVGHPVAVNPDRELLQVAREHGWEVLRLDRLRRRIAIGGMTAVAAVAGGAGSVILAGRRRP